MKQVQFTCKMEAFQKDVVGAVTIYDTDLITDPIFTLNLKNLVE